MLSAQVQLNYKWQATKKANDNENSTVLNESSRVTSCQVNSIGVGSNSIRAIVWAAAHQYIRSESSGG